MIVNQTEEFETALLSLNKMAAKNLISEIAQAEGAMQCVEKVVIPVMEQIGSKWEDGNVALSQLYMSGRICEEIVDAILPAIDPARKRQPNMAIVVFNDYHFLGKRIVYTMLRASGFELKDYAQTTDIEELVLKVQNDDIKVLLVSVLMLNSALRIKDLIEKLKVDSPKTKVIVGGAPFRFDENLWQEIGADAMGKNASEAVKIVTNIMDDIL
ncbi:cobalamin-dependent protein [Candidatus Halobeggiatoa sp. HSG11]|nr:cobalamin-dependent protein [Candidatus Halobeggiatoa sp. HSG11]